MHERERILVRPGIIEFVRKVPAQRELARILLVMLRVAVVCMARNIFPVDRNECAISREKGRIVDAAILQIACG